MDILSYILYHDTFVGPEISMAPIWSAWPTSFQPCPKRLLLTRGLQAPAGWDMAQCRQDPYSIAVAVGLLSSAKASW